MAPTCYGCEPTIGARLVHGEDPIEAIDTMKQTYINKAEILNGICYTELVYGRINKKLRDNLSRLEIERMIFDVVKGTEETFFQRIGKNIYVTSAEHNIKITINSYTYRIITVDRVAGG